jgi:hypothetical protein
MAVAPALALALSACSSSARVSVPSTRTQLGRSVKVAFVGQEVWFVAPDRRWRLEGVSKGEVVWAPSGRQLAYTKMPAGSSQRWRIVVRDDSGEPVNEFAVYSDGKPEGIEFHGDRRLAYEIALTEAAAKAVGAVVSPAAPAPPVARVPVEPPRVLVEHDVRSGEIVAVHRGRSFVWSPDRRQLAYIGQRALGDRVQVDATRVYPRAEQVRGVSVVSRLSWSPDGRGLAFLVHRAPPKKGRRPPPPGSGKVVLVVILEPEDASGDLTWEVPPGKDASEVLNVFWAGKSRVVVGPAQMKPRFSASWQRER